MRSEKGMSTSTQWFKSEGGDPTAKLFTLSCHENYPSCRMDGGENRRTNLKGLNDPTMEWTCNNFKTKDPVGCDDTQGVKWKLVHLHNASSLSLSCNLRHFQLFVCICIWGWRDEQKKEKNNGNFSFPQKDGLPRHSYCTIEEKEVKIKAISLSARCLRP